MKYILILLLFISCGTRKTDMQHHESLEVNNSYSEGSKIVLGNSLKYTPFDNAKPYFVNGQEYRNVAITIDKGVTIEKWKTRNITKTITIDKVKITEKKDDTILWICIVLGSILIIGCLVWLWFYMPKFK